LPESREFNPDDARAKHRPNDAPEWLQPPDDVVVVDHLPGLSNRPLFASYADWFAALQDWLPRASTPDRIGLRQIEPGVWVGLHARVSPEAELRAPCWLGENVYVGPDAVIGPHTILEDRVFVEGRAEVTGSIVGPDTFVGELTQIHDSLAWGNRLVNWRTNSCVEVHDRFLLGSLVQAGPDSGASARLRRLTHLLAGAVRRSRAAVHARSPEHGLSPALRQRDPLFSSAMQVSLSKRTATPSANE